MLYVIKEGTAVLFWISSAAVIPVVAILSTTSLYDGLDLGRVSLSALQICGLALVVFGIAVYRSKREVYALGQSCSMPFATLFCSAGPGLVCSAVFARPEASFCAGPSRPR